MKSNLISVLTGSVKSHITQNFSTIWGLNLMLLVVDRESLNTIILQNAEIIILGKKTIENLLAGGHIS